MEAALRYVKTFGNGFNLNLAGNVSYARNQILEWIETPAYPNLSVIGTPADAERGLVALGDVERLQQQDDADVLAPAGGQGGKGEMSSWPRIPFRDEERFPMRCRQHP